MRLGSFKTNKIHKKSQREWENYDFNRPPVCHKIYEIEKFTSALLMAIKEGGKDVQFVSDVGLISSWDDDKSASHPANSIYDHFQFQHFPSFQSRWTISAFLVCNLSCKIRIRVCNTFELFWSYCGIFLGVNAHNTFQSI